jgi:hypothetical protein
MIETTTTYIPFSFVLAFLEGKLTRGRCLLCSVLFAVGIEPQTVPGSMWIISLSDGSKTQKSEHKKMDTQSSRTTALPATAV